MLENCTATTRLLPSIATDKQYRNLQYLLRLTDDNLLFSFRMEAGFINNGSKKTDVHWGWDSPFSQIRGTFTGHWLSAAAKLYHKADNPILKARADYIVSEIGKCQAANGGRWAFPIPEKYLYWLRDGRHIWAPQYVCHKVMMGLLDMYRYAGNAEALEIVKSCADWFYDFTADISRETMDEMMDNEETGGILELWADLYAITSEPKHLELLHRYERPHLFEPLLAKIDVLSNLHANTTVPEILGAARAYEVTGDIRYRQIVENFWTLAVDERGSFVTGGQTSGEMWTPPYQQAARLSDRNQEHCVVYHMMKLSQYLYRWTGASQYADYYEQNLWNGIFAQGHWEEEWDMLASDDRPAARGLLTYYLPLAAGSHKLWADDVEHFWCCVCTLVQANASFHEAIFYQENDKIVVGQFLPAETDFTVNDVSIRIKLEKMSQTGENIRIHAIDRELLSRPDSDQYQLKVNGNNQHFRLAIRLPWWLVDKAEILLNGVLIDYAIENGHAVLEHIWGEQDIVQVIFPKKLQTWALPDEPETVAFIDGPIAFAGIVAEERTLYGDIEHPESFVKPANERLWNIWRPDYRTVGQPVNFRLTPLYKIGNETYTVYFPVEKRK